jgi:hypothetical protein
MYPIPDKRRLTEAELARVTEVAITMIHDRVDDLTTEAWIEGLTWYEKANVWCRSLAYDWEPVAWALAVLSPRNSWNRNKDDLVSLMRTGTCSAIGYAVKRAVRILAGEDPELVAGGRKVRSFGRNIAYPHNSLDVTIDSHMGKVMGLADIRYLERRGVYDALANAVRAVAPDHGVAPHQLQAALWVEARA